ncbi:hypothetical protein KR009_004169 [Drosophila setifemur]|nr:hypothetical protein KR009_004169 [Drosophila setifemur]
MPLYMACLMKVSAVLISHPMELMRVNIQANAMNLSQHSLRHMIRLMAKHGLPGFYFGFSTAAMRVGIHTFTSFHLFYSLRDNKYVQMLQPFDTTTVHGFGSFGGGILATPFAKLSVIRQSDLTRTPFQRRNYKHFWNGLKCMYNKGGIGYLFHGWRINSLSSAAVALLYPPVYEVVIDKLALLNGSEGIVWVQELSAIAVSGSILTLIMTPVDGLATLILNDTKYEAVSYRRIYMRILKRHGYGGFFLGWRAALLGFLPHAILATAVHYIWWQYW